ncbi:MAG TPA: tol-pal system protein YbgF [Thermoanaerobaculia bacterium]|nr:tol-pal system protein YbgF [Thermoanaerobaculia bacterium]
MSRKSLSRSRGLLALAALVPAAACVSSSDIDGLHRQMNDIEKEIQVLEKRSSSKEEVSRLNTNVSSQTDQLLKSNADASQRLNELATKMERLEAKLEDTNRRLAQLSQQIAETQGILARLGASAGAASASANPGGAGPAGGPADTAVVRAPAPAAGHPAPAELYDTAYADYTKGRYPLAISGFQEYVAAYPNTDLSDNAQYWIGESYYAQKKWSEAIAAFDKLGKQWPKSDKAAAGLLKKAYALAEMGSRAEAVVQLQYVMHEFPTSEESRLARAKLKTMGVEAR